MSLRDLFIEIGIDIDSDPLEDINKELDELKKTVQNSSIDELEKDLKDASKAADEAGKSVSEITKEVNNTGGPLGFFKRTIEGVKNSASGGLRRLGDGFKNLPGVIGGAVMKVGSSVTNFVTAPIRGALGLVKQFGSAIGVLSAGGLIKSGIDRLSSIETTRIGFEVMMGDTSKANAFMDEVLAFAKTTPYAFPELADSSKKLYAFGVQQEKIIPTMKAIGDASAVIGRGEEGISLLTNAFGDMAVSSRLSLGPISQLEDQGIPALKILANQYDTTVDSMRSQIQKGAIDSVEAIDFLVEGMQEGTDGLAGATAPMAGMMDRLKETFSGAWGDMGSSISNAMATIIEPLMPKITATLLGIGAAFGKLPDFVFGMYERIKPTIDSFTSVFEDAFSSSKEYISSFQSTTSNVFESVRPIIEAVVNILQGLWDVIVNLVNNVVIPLIPVIYEIISTAFTAIQPVITAVSTAFNFVKDIVIFLVNNVIVPLIPVASSIIQTAFDLVNPILRIAGSLFEVIINVVKFLVENIVKPLIPVISVVLTDMWNDAKPILDGLVSVFNAIADGIEWAIDKFKSFSSAVKDFKMPSFGMPKWMGGGGFIQGSHASGLGRVPMDGYTAELHKNEAVLTASQANALRSTGMLKGDGAGPTLDLSKAASYEPLESSPSSTTTNNNRSAIIHAPVNIVIEGSNDPKKTSYSVKEELEEWFDDLNDVFPVILEG